MKKLLAILPFGVLAGALAVGAVSLSAKGSKEVKADAPSYQTYVPVVDGWVENTDGSGESTVNSLLRGRNDRFWSGGSGWDSQERTFNAMDEFIDTIHRANGGEGWRGAYRTPELELYDNNHRYISFLFGGGSGDIFINIFQVNGAAGSGDRITGIRTAFDGSGAYPDDTNHLNAPISCNMVFKYFELPNEIQPGDHFLIYVRDGKQSDYGGFTFGDVHINQTLEECAKHFSVHKQQVKFNEYTSDYNAAANEYVLNFYATDSYYATIRTAEAALTDADCDFDVNDHLSNWAHDRSFSEAGIWYNDVISDNDAKNWTERMPANKSGNRYFNADATGINEDEKYRLVSNEFTLSGTGFISAKLGGGTAVMSLIDNTGAELVSSRVAAAEGTNILNGGFVDAAVANVMSSGARLNTMSRTYLDASAHLGKKVRVVLSDERTGGNWGLAYFDEVVTKYTSLPTLKVDRIQQQYGENPTYHGVVTDKYVGSNSTTFGQAYAFVQRFYGLMRDNANGGSWCSIAENSQVTTLLNDYKALDSDVKAIVDAAQDFDFGAGATSANFFSTQADLSHTVGQTFSYIDNEVSGGMSLVRPNLFGDDNKSATTVIAIVLLVSTVALGLTAFVIKRKKATK